MQKCARYYVSLRLKLQLIMVNNLRGETYRLNEMLEENPAYQQGMRLYTIVYTLKYGYQAYKYTY